MHPPHLRIAARQMHDAGIPFSEIHRRLDLPRRTVGDWLYRHRADPTTVERHCRRCRVPPREIDDPASYCYLLGQYLGDGHLLTTQRIPLLAIACDNRYLGLIHETTSAMEACGVRTVGYQEGPGCIRVRSYWMHWPCLLPQHGKGAKHLRKIELADWQQEMVDKFPGRLIRGLFHSDGSRSINRINRHGKVYEYPRYNFVNESADIMRICQVNLDRLGVAWRMPRRNMLSVARRADVARLDEFVGPKW